jgi:hypothetical protein
MNPRMMNAARTPAIMYFDSNKSLAKIMNMIFRNANSMIASMKNMADPFRP